MTAAIFHYHYDMAAKGSKKSLAIIVAKVDELIKYRQQRMDKKQAKKKKDEKANH